MQKILKNAIRCNHCGEIIQSRRQYDFVTCKCGCCSVDGGADYLRRGFTYSRADFTELSQFEGEAPDAPAGEGSPYQMHRWTFSARSMFPDGQQCWILHGEAYGNPRFSDGRPIYTSPILQIRDLGNALEVETLNSVYRCPLGCCMDRFFFILNDPAGLALFQGSAAKLTREKLLERIKPLLLQWLTRDDPELNALLPAGDWLALRFSADHPSGFQSLTVRQNGQMYHYEGHVHLCMRQDSFLIGTEPWIAGEWSGPRIDFRYLPKLRDRTVWCKFYRVQGWDGPVYGICRGPLPLIVSAAPPLESFQDIPLPRDGKPHLLWEKLTF